MYAVFSYAAFLQMVLQEQQYQTKNKPYYKNKSNERLTIGRKFQHRAAAWS